MVVRKVFLLSAMIAAGAIIVSALALSYGLELFELKSRAWEYHARSRLMLAEMARTVVGMERVAGESASTPTDPADAVQRLHEAGARLDALNTSRYAPDSPLEVTGLRQSLTELDSALVRFSSGDIARLDSRTHRSLAPYRADVLSAIDRLDEAHQRSMTALESRYRNRLAGAGFGLAVTIIVTAVVLLTVFGLTLGRIHRDHRRNRETLTELHRAQGELEKLAYHDSLTELPNRRLFYTHLRQILGMAERSDLRFALVLLDIDDFKYVNDNLGHQEGDLLLRAVAQRLQFSLREVDLVARVGGDEFAVVLSDAGSEREVTVIADKLMERVTQPLSLGKHSYRPSLSMGAYLVGPGERDPDAVMKSVDLALYEAKEQGKGRYCFHTPELETTAERRFAVERQIRQALDGDELMLHLQPQIRIASGQVVGFEALVRWREPGGELIYPDAFIPRLMDNRLIGDLAHWVIDEGLAQAATLHGNGFKEVDMALNISARQLHHAELPERLQSLLSGVGMESYRIKLEITEAALLEHINESRAVLETLRDMGFRISIDDFGTGYSSLSYLKLLAADEIKIDGSYIAHIAEDPEMRELVKAIISLAHGLKMLVVAEGVETREQFEVLRVLDCDVAQGFYTGAPATLAEWLASGAGGRMHPPAGSRSGGECKPAPR